MVNNKRHMGHTLTWESVQINTYDYIISLIRRRKYPFLCENWMVIVLHLTKLESPSPKDALCQDWLKLAQWFWRRRWKCEKFTDRQTDDGRQVIRKAHLSFQLRWAKKHLFCTSAESERRKSVSLAHNRRWHVRRICAEHAYTPVSAPLRNDLLTSLPEIDNINEDVVIDHSAPSTDSDWTGCRVVELGVLAEGLKACKKMWNSHSSPSCHRNPNLQTCCHFESKTTNLTPWSTNTDIYNTQFFKHIFI